MHLHNGQFIIVVYVDIPETILVTDFKDFKAYEQCSGSCHLKNENVQGHNDISDTSVRSMSGFIVRNSIYNSHKK